MIIYQKINMRNAIYSPDPLIDCAPVDCDL